jgi:O-antigen/teichoic acid export membrane protein
LARRLHRRAYQASLILSVCCAGFLWLFGPTVYYLWVRRSVALDLSSFHLLLVASIANSLWFASLVVQMSANRHSRLALTYLVVAIASCGLGYLLTERLGLFGAALALLLADVVMCGVVLPMSLKQMQDTPRDFLRAVFGSVPSFPRPLLAARVSRR